MGPSAALNCVGAVKAARQLGRGHTVVTVLCDGGDRYRSTTFNPAFLSSKARHFLVVLSFAQSSGAWLGRGPRASRASFCALFFLTALSFPPSPLFLLLQGLVPASTGTALDFVDE